MIIKNKQSSGLSLNFSTCATILQRMVNNFLGELLQRRLCSFAKPHAFAASFLEKAPLGWAVLYDSPALQILAWQKSSKPSWQDNFTGMGRSPSAAFTPPQLPNRSARMIATKPAKRLQIINRRGRGCIPINAATYDICAAAPCMKQWLLGLKGTDRFFGFVRSRLYITSYVCNYRRTKWLALTGIALGSRNYKFARDTRHK